MTDKTKMYLATGILGVSIAVGTTFGVLKMASTPKMTITDKTVEIPDANLTFSISEEKAVEVHKSIGEGIKEYENRILEGVKRCVYTLHQSEDPFEDESIISVYIYGEKTNKFGEKWVSMKHNPTHRGTDTKKFWWFEDYKEIDCDELVKLQIKYEGEL